jgi:hypothetical protein
MLRLYVGDRRGNRAAVDFGTQQQGEQKHGVT